MSEKDDYWFDLGYESGKSSRDAEIAALRQQLSTFHSAVEHVTEDGCTRRSVVAMPEGWAMVHKDRLHDLELAEEQLATTEPITNRRRNADDLSPYILFDATREN